MQIGLELVSERLDADDERWLAAEADLLGSLREEVGEVSVVRTAAAGQKGALDTVVLALGSAGAFRAAVACFRAWLQRDRTRRVRITWRDGDAVQEIEIDSAGLSGPAFERLARALDAHRPDGPRG
ncbi:effector-associated constant component EACC1 [Dactylosporangium sp. CA-233914]|uniref:effector-associated constant component EACC1 n=1 Tax=Dactylosporangium sp. CA-233914 TaxID=3239934 RepID=UPI003D8CC321